MAPAVPFPIRQECPPGACDCARETLEHASAHEQRILLLTREEEKKLLAHIENIASYADLLKLGQRLATQLGVQLDIAPRAAEVRSVMGLQIELRERPGLCRKTRKTVPAAIRRCLEQHPHIVYAILDAHDLFGLNT